MNFKSLPIGVGLAIALSGSLHAASVVSHSDLASFQSAAGSTSLIDFEGIVADNFFGSPGGRLVSAFDLGGVNFSTSLGTIGISGPNSSVGGNPFDSAILFSNNDSPITLTFGAGVFSVAGLFGDINGTSAGASVSIFGSSGLLGSTSFTAPDLGPGSAGFFTGFTSDMAISSLVYTGVTSWEGLDDIRIGGQSSPPPVPVPAGGVLLVSGMFGFAAMRRKKKQLK